MLKSEVLEVQAQRLGARIPAGQHVTLEVRVSLDERK